MRVTMLLAWQVANPINYMQTTEANRYPFGVVRARHPSLRLVWHWLGELIWDSPKFEGQIQPWQNEKRIKRKRYGRSG